MVGSNKLPALSFGSVPQAATRKISKSIDMNGLKVQHHALSPMAANTMILQISLQLVHLFFLDMALKFLLSLLVVTAMAKKEDDNNPIVNTCPLWACITHPMRWCRKGSFCREGKIPHNCQVAHFMSFYVILQLLGQFWGLEN